MSTPVKIYDTTLRDGAQSYGVTFSLEDKLRIAAALDDLGVHYIEGGWPGSNPKDAAFFKAAQKVPFKRSKLAVFSCTKHINGSMHEDKNIQQLIRSETPVVTIFGKTWNLHVERALGIELPENLDMIQETITYLRGYFDEIIFDAEHFFDGYRARDGYALEAVKAAQQAGCDWIVLCDTNGGTLPDQCAAIVSKVSRTMQKPLGIHCHNDAELAVANSLAAVDHGVEMIQGTINGLGERCGNANLCSIIANLTLKLGRSIIPTENLSKLNYISRLVSELTNQTHPRYLPYTGSHAFAHKGGIHVSAVRGDPCISGSKRSLHL
jgi:2-isopropylmalate synthase